MLTALQSNTATPPRRKPRKVVNPQPQALDPRALVDDFIRKHAAHTASEAALERAKALVRALGSGEHLGTLGAISVTSSEPQERLDRAALERDMGADFVKKYLKKGKEPVPTVRFTRGLSVEEAGR